MIKKAYSEAALDSNLIVIIYSAIMRQILLIAALSLVIIQYSAKYFRIDRSIYGGLHKKLCRS